MKHFILRLSLAALMPLAVLKPVPGHGETVAAQPAEERMGRISVITMGNKGTPVILIPGLASPRAVWDGIAPDLARNHRVFLVQINGFSGDDPGQNLSAGLLDGVVADLDTYIARRKLAGPAVIGHSMGGLIGLMLAKAHPDDVAKLMVVDSLPWFGAVFAPPGVSMTAAMIEPQARAMRDRIAATYGKPVDPATVDAQTRNLALKPESIARMKIWAAAADPRVTALGVYEDLTTDLRGDMAAIKTPITLVYPWNTSTILTEANAHAFYHAQYAGAPSITYSPIGDAAHFVMLDQPQQFATAVSVFLRGQ
ncbi:MAG: alpha/beta hydrolase [Sphingomonas sp.]